MIIQRLSVALGLAVLVLAAATALRYAQSLEIIGMDAARRSMQVMIGLILAGYANFLPKDIGRWQPSALAARRAQAALRVGGWSLTLAGLAYSGLWAFAPISVADVAATAVLATATLVTTIYAAWAFFTCRRSARGSGRPGSASTPESAVGKAALSAALLFFAAASTTNAQEIRGDWQGTLAAGTVEIRLVLHLTPNEQGGFTATLDSPDQGAIGIGVTAVRLEESTLQFEVPQIGGSYRGTLDAGAGTITGTWSQQGKTLPLDLARPARSSRTRAAKPSDIDGDWAGTLQAVNLRLVLHVQTFEDGTTATLDSPDQGMFGLPVTSVTRDGTTLRFEMKQLGASIRGAVDAGLTAIEGTWSQLGTDLPLVLQRVR